jgi:folylpolyglutamate synthase/dihydropteroate synthase
MLADKDCREVCATFAPAARRILAVPVDSARTANARSVAAWCSEFNPSIIVESHERFDAALQAAQQDPFVIVTGSLYLVGQALEALGASPVAAGSERHLNEWSIRT